MTPESPESTRTEFTLNDDENPQPSCWPRRIPLRMGLVLLLCATLPFLIALTIMYIFFGTVWNKSEKCETICDVMESARAGNSRTIIFDSPNWGASEDGRPSAIIQSYDYGPFRQKGVTTSRKVSESGPKKDTFCPEEKPQFPFVAALLENLYRDDGEDHIVKCPVALLSKEWVLTTEECAGDSKTKLNILSVRINSDYWAKGGIVKKIRTMMSFKKLIAIQVERIFGENSFCYTPAKIDSNQLALLTMGHIFLWDTRLNQPLKKRKKFSKMERVPVQLKFSNNETIGYTKAEANARWSSSPLFDRTEKYLVGFQSMVTVDGWNIFVNISEYVPWLEFIGAIKHI